MPSRFLLVFLAILLDATILFAAKYGHSRFAEIAPRVRPSRRVLLTEKQIERKKLRKEERLKTREEERKKRQEDRKNGSNNNTTATNVTGDLSTNAPSTATSSGISVSSPTASPTLSLTAQPSSTPSETPTTNAPSLRPSASPTQVHSSSPSSSPTDAPLTPDPTASPSNAPVTSDPTMSPTAVHSDSPSSSPTASPVTPNPTISPTAVQTTIACDDQGLVTSGLAVAIIRFKYQIEFKPSVNEDDAVNHVDASVAQVVASAFLPCFQPADDGYKRLDEETDDTSQTFELLAVDSLPKDAVSPTETCTAQKGNWNCVIVQGAVTTYFNDLEQFDLDAVLSSIETSSLYGSLNLPSDESVERTSVQPQLSVNRSSKLPLCLHQPQPKVKNKTLLHRPDHLTMCTELQ